MDALWSECLGPLLVFILKALAALVAGYLTLVLMYTWHVQRKLSHIPGPRPLPVLGNLPHVVDRGSGGIHVVCHKWQQQYGHIFRLYFGKTPLVMISDPALARQVCVRQFATFRDRNQLSWFPLPAKVLESVSVELVFAGPPLWGSLRAALQPFFHSDRLRSYAPLMNESALQLRSLLEDAAQRHPGQAVDVLQLTGRFALDVLGRAAFGFDFDALKSAALQMEEEEKEKGGGKKEGPHMDNYLVRAVRSVFDSNVIFDASQNLVLMLLGMTAPPPLDRMWQWIAANVCQSRAGREGLAGRTAIFSTADALLANATSSMERKQRQQDTSSTEKTCELRQGEGQEEGRKEQKQQQEQQDGGWRWWSESDVKDNPYLGRVPRAGSLVDLLATARSKAAQTAGGGEGVRQHLSELEVVTNTYEMIAAGYETTGTTLAIALHCLAASPKATRRLLQEVDDVMSSQDGGDVMPSREVDAVTSSHPPASDEGAVTYEDLVAGGKGGDKGEGKGGGKGKGTRSYPYAEAVLKETLRLYPAATLIGRHAHVDTKIGGYLVPANTSVLVNIWSIMRDPAVFPNPDRFDPGRWLVQEGVESDQEAAVARAEAHFLAFGLGPRSCIGMRFALEEASIALVRLYQRMTFELQEEGEGEEVVHAAGGKGEGAMSVAQGEALQEGKAAAGGPAAAAAAADADDDDDDDGETTQRLPKTRLKLTLQPIGGVRLVPRLRQQQPSVRGA